MAATDIKISQMPAATTLVGDELVPIVQDGSNKSTTIAKIIEGLATEEWVTQAIADTGGNGGGKILVVTELPQTGESNTIYMIPNESSRTNDIYDEYVWLTEGSKWEFLGNKHVEVDLSDYYNKGDINGLLNNKVDKVSGKALSTNDYTNEDKAAVATISNKQDILVSGTNIKTINSQSLLGQGNIEITVEGGGITDAPSDSKTYGRKNAQWSEVVIPDTSDMLTKTEASSTYQTKGNYLTTETASTTYATKAEIPSLDNYYNKTEIDDKLDDITTGGDVDLSNYYNKTESDSRYVAKEEGKVLSSNDYTNEDKAAVGTISNKADKTELANKQDTLVSGTNIKTINGETILGSGDIEVEGESTAIVDHGTNDTTFELTPNVLHKWNEVASLTLTLGAETPNIVNEFMIQFTSGATATQLSLPETVKWIETPTVEANKTYQVSIVNNLAVIGGWSNE